MKRVRSHQPAIWSVLIAFAFVLFVGCETLQAASLEVGAAVDAAGVLHSARDYPKGQIPWVHDQLRNIVPEYPYEERARHRQGDGLFRVLLDLRSGKVTRIIVVKSTGFKGFDDSAIKALSKCRWKPGRWKEIDYPITFNLVLPKS